MASIEDRWVRDGGPSARHGIGRRYRVRWNDREGREISRSFSDADEAASLAGMLEQQECPTAAETTDGLCRAHGNQKLRLEHLGSGTYVHRKGACVMPDPILSIPDPDGTVRLCGNTGKHDVGGASFCDGHYERITAWLEEQLEKVASVDRDWMMGSEATGRQVVYYLRRESDGLIKIGTSSRFGNRLRTLRGEHGPLRILLTHVGDREREQKLHATFAGWWVEGEWFQPGAGLLEWIAEVRRRPVNANTAVSGTEPLDYVLGLEPAPDPDWDAIMARSGRGGLRATADPAA
jgi:hypothetical protein